MKGFKRLKINSIDEKITFKSYREVHKYLNINSIDGIFLLNNDSFDKMCKSFKYTKGTIDTSINFLIKVNSLKVIERYYPSKNKVYEGLEVGSRQYQRASVLKNKYSIDNERLKLLYESQSFKCAICSRTEDEAGKFDIDHCHKSGHVRGLLCRSCNLGLGMFSDNTGILSLAIKYLNTK